MPSLLPRLRDRFGRTVDYLRVSVTDRCDLRCTYCMPRGYNDFEDRDRLDGGERLTLALKKPRHELVKQLAPGVWHPQGASRDIDKHVQEQRRSAELP